MTTPEAKVKDQIKAFLKILAAYWHMPVQNGMGSPALDFHVCIPIIVTPGMVGKTIGVYASIEAKAPGKSPTLRQQLTMRDIEQAGGKAFVVDDNCREIAAWLLELKA